MKDKPIKRAVIFGKRRLFAILLVFLTTNWMAANNMLQSQTVNVNFKNTLFSEAVWELKKQTDLKFMYNSSDVEEVVVRDLKANDVSVEYVLASCLNGTEIEYRDIDGIITFMRKAPKVAATKYQSGRGEVKGVVYDDMGEVIIGANIMIKGTTNGIISDIDGNFSLKVSSDKPVTLVVSFIGFKTQEVKATPNMPIKIILKDDNTLLEEVVVTGYGSFKKSAYAGSASFVKNEKMKDVPNLSVQQMLEGATTGVQVSSSSGVPGATSSIRIRGMGSFNASNSPLYVIDGVPVMSGNFSNTSTGSGLDIMSTINPSDIESMTVVKDAAAASLYGSRAANGVILINTKQGKKGKPIFTFKSDWGFSKFAMDFREMMGGQERRDVIYEGLQNQAQLYKGKPNNGLKENMTPEEIKLYADSRIDEFAPIPWCGFVDWNDHMFQTGKRSNYDFSASGATDKFKYYTSLAYTEQDGVAINSGLDRITGRLNVDYKMTKRFSMGTKVLFSNIKQDSYSEGLSYNTPIYGTRNGATPSDPIWLEDGSWNRDLIKLDDRNPLLSQEYNYKKENITRMLNSMFASFEIYKDLVLKSTFSYDFVSGKGKSWHDPRTSDGGNGKNGSFGKSNTETTKMNWNMVLSYLYHFKSGHNLDALVGYEVERKDTDYLSARRSNFARPDKVDLNTGMKLEGASGNVSGTRMISYLTRLNYDFKSKYYAGASWRTDGSSRLSRDNRWGHFWSLSGAWRVSAEKFMEATSSWLTDMKLRLSYGVNGTLPSGYYPYQALSSLTSSYDDQPGILQSQIENNELTWESNHNFNAGLDLSFLDNRISLTLEYYRRTTKDLLYARPLSITTGFSSYLANIGKMRNEGVELELSTLNFESKNFSWTTSLNLSHNRNKILRLDGELSEVISNPFIRKVGKSYYTFYLIEFAGINPENGMPQFYSNKRDENGNLQRDLVYDPNDAERVELGAAEPKLTGSIGNYFRYRWFDLGFNLNFSTGGKTYDSAASKMEHGGDGKLNIPTYYRNRWMEEGDRTSIERFVIDRNISMNSYATSRRIHSRNFIRLKSLTFGATFPKEWTRRVFINKARVFLSGNNLLTWAKYKEYDPEYGTMVDWSTPPLKTITFGLEVNF